MNSTCITYVQLLSRWKDMPVKKLEPMKRLVLVCLATVALWDGAGVSSAWGRGFHGGGFHGHGGFHRHGGFHGHFGVFIGAPFFWDPFFYPYGHYPYPAPVYIEREPPPVYIQREPYYWYYCSDPSGYYPYIQTCPKGWQRVVPSPPQQ
jgi:hypothetical protein